MFLFAFKDQNISRKRQNISQNSYIVVCLEVDSEIENVQRDCRNGGWVVGLGCMKKPSSPALIDFYSPPQVGPDTELSTSELLTLSCGVLFFLSFFVAMYVEVKASDTIYQVNILIV